MVLDTAAVLSTVLSEKNAKGFKLTIFVDPIFISTVTALKSYNSTTTSRECWLSCFSTNKRECEPYPLEGHCIAYLKSFERKAGGSSALSIRWG